MTTTDQDNHPVRNDTAEPSHNRVSMEPLFERLLRRSFPDSVSAIDYCRSLCGEFGFTVKQEASANRNIYVYCSREGLPDSQRNPKPSPQRKRPSKRCDCRWRVVLSENDQERWEFRKSMNPNASEHNHDMMAPEEMVMAWPSHVTDLIVDLARKRLQTHEIRETVKSRFPDITWNERRFYNRLTEERKRIRQRGVLERTQRLILLSAHLCSLVAAHEEWSDMVQAELSRMLENFCRMSQLPPEAVASHVHLHTDMIQTEPTERTKRRSSSGAGSGGTGGGGGSGGGDGGGGGGGGGGGDGESSSSDRPSPSSTDMALDEPAPAKKRKSISRSPDAPKGTQVIHVPGYTLYVRNQTSRSVVEPPSAQQQQHAMMGLADASGRRSVLGSPPDPLTHQAFGTPNAALFPMASPTLSSSSNSSMPFRHPAYSRRFEQRNVVSSPMHQSIVPTPQDPSFMTYTPHPPQHQGNFGLPSAANPAYPMPSSFVSYAMPPAPMGTGDNMSFGFDSAGMATATGAPTAIASSSQHPNTRVQRAMAQDRTDPAQSHDYPPARSGVSTSTTSSPTVYENYPIKEEQLDQRMMFMQQREHQQHHQQQQQQQQQQRLQRSLSQQGYMTSIPVAHPDDGSQEQPHHDGRDPTGTGTHWM